MAVGGGRQLEDWSTQRCRLRGDRLGNAPERAGAVTAVQSSHFTVHSQRCIAGVIYAAFLVAFALLTAGCGYHTAGHAVLVPTNVRTIAVPAFTNETQSYRVEQL